MIRVCSWCKKQMGKKEEYSSEGDITHGICSQCMIKVTNDGIPRSAVEILDFIQEPVFLIDSEGVVKAGNQSGSALVGKEIEQIADKLGGDVFECSYAKEKGGCGKTVHCKTCAIRNIVMDTLSSNNGYVKVPAFQNIMTSDGPKIMKFDISTEKVGECILLRIDQISES